MSRSASSARSARTSAPGQSSKAARHGLARAGWEDGSFEPLEVQPEGGRRMTVEAWRRGLR